MRHARLTLTALLFAIMALVAHASGDTAARMLTEPDRVCVSPAPARHSDLITSQTSPVLRGALQPGPRASAESDDVMIVFELILEDTY